MLTTNERLDKLAAAHVDFTSCGMLVGTCLSKALMALLGDEVEPEIDLSSDDEGPDAEGQPLEDADKEAADVLRTGEADQAKARRRREEHERNVDIINEEVEGLRVGAFVELARCPGRDSSCSSYTYLILMVSQ